ncbi:helix-turn-helix domain-containing protein [Nocardioides soli]|uniref:AraC-like DNA-binding protein n=1 Tax=Nocardioides soli TaxID=1036020 RepID=A0A7W4Z1F9_9ACTN|nr:AraC-like DNA-binding protein [Nocardioides soli]
MPARSLLLWVRAGTAHVHLDGRAALRLSAGTGVWIPADGWMDRDIVTEPGTVAFPLWPHASVGSPGLSAPTQFDVPERWQDWLIQLFNLQVTPFNGRGYSPDAITDLIRRPASRPPAPAPIEHAATLPGPALTVIPRARGARAVAEELLRDPALDLTVEQWAAQVLTSPRTLRRDFIADTGLTFDQWRSGCRLGAAVELLAAGYDTDQVAARVGFASRNGLTRAFKGRFGLTPHEFGRQFSARPASGDMTPRARAARQADDLMRLMRGDDTPAAPEMLPATSTPSHTNDIHVLSWVYRGSGYLDIGADRYERERGVATWIPAGLEHVTGLRENSISLPLGNASTADLQLTGPMQVRFPSAWDDFLMFCSVSARSGLRPPDHDPAHVVDLFTDQVAAQRALSVPMPTDARAHSAAMDYLRRIGSSDLPGPDVPPDIHRAFREETGMTVTRWRYAARMRVARDLLASGAKPHTVARRVGYAHLPTFSTAFSRFHGLSPREYQERDAEGDR